MHVLDLILASKHSTGIPYITLDVCHTRQCPSWRIGKKHGPCNCGAESMLSELRAQLRSIQVPDWLVKSVGGSIARKAKHSHSDNGNRTTQYETVKDSLRVLALAESEAMELIEIIGDNTK